MLGSCLCGAIRYEIDGLDGPINHCSCRTCRKAHAAAFSSTAAVDRAHFRWLAGQDKLSSFESSPGKLRHFCSICGSHLIAERAVQSHVILRVATLDDDPGQKPELAIWRSHEVPWLDYGPDVPGYAELPSALLVGSDSHHLSNSTNAIRPASQDDRELLWEFLAIAAYVPNAEAARAQRVVATHLEGWQRTDDFGFVAERDGRAIGAACARQSSAREEPAFYVDDRTPEISIGIREGDRGQGVGERCYAL